MWTTTTTFGQFVPENHHSLFNFPQVYQAYLDCRRNKRNSDSALAYELDHEADLLRLCAELREGRYRPGTSICFYTEKPKSREIFAADFRDRIVHHLVYNLISPLWEKVFIDHSYACRLNKGTHAAADTLQKFLRSASKNGKVRACYLKMDIHNFFMRIKREILFAMLSRRCRNNDLLNLLKIIVFHDPTTDYILHDNKNLRPALPRHKSLFHAREGCGLPIGNLTSQFFANVYLNALDQFVKHQLKAKYYLRYVDDFLLINREQTVLERWQKAIENFLHDRLELDINARATRIAPLSGGVDFAGFIVRPHYKLVRRRVVGNLKEKLRLFEFQLVKKMADITIYRFPEDVLAQCQATVNAYLGQFSHAQTRRLTYRLWTQFPFLKCYFTLRNYQIMPRQQPLKKLTRLWQQIRWFRKHYPKHYCFLQIGFYYEIFGAHAKTFAGFSGFRLLEGWRGVPYACGFPHWRLADVEKELQSRCMPYLIVRESGRELYAAKERLPSMLVEYYSNPTT